MIIHFANDVLTLRICLHVDTRTRVWTKGDDTCTLSDDIFDSQLVFGRISPHDEVSILRLGLCGDTHLNLDLKVLALATRPMIF